MKEDIAIAKNNILQLQQENSILRSEKEALLEEHRKQMQVSHHSSYYNRYVLQSLINVIACSLIWIYLTCVNSDEYFCLIISVKTAQDDIDTERAAYHMSRQGLDTMYKDIQQRLRIEALGKQVCYFQKQIIIICNGLCWE